MFNLVTSHISNIRLQDCHDNYNFQEIIVQLIHQNNSPVIMNNDCTCIFIIVLKLFSIKRNRFKFILEKVRLICINFVSLSGTSPF